MLAAIFRRVRKVEGEAKGPVRRKIVNMACIPRVDIARPITGLVAEGPWRSLVAAHRSRLQHFIQRHIGHADDAEDLAQQAFIEALNSYAGFRREAELSTWLYGIAKNLVRNYLSRAPQKRYVFCGDDCLQNMQDYAPSPQEVLEREQRLQALAQELEALPVRLRHVLWLVTVDGLSYEDAAQQLAIPIGTVRSRVFRARHQLRMRMDCVYGRM